MDAIGGAAGVSANGGHFGVDAVGYNAGVSATGSHDGVAAVGYNSGVSAMGGDAGVAAVGEIGVAAVGENAGVAAMGRSGPGVIGISFARAHGVGGEGVIGLSANDTGVYGESVVGYGGSFSGGLAPLRLEPSDAQGSPNSGAHLVGEFYVGNHGSLYFCVVSGTPGKWKKVGLV